jgi:hypothetical protein
VMVVMDWWSLMIKDKFLSIAPSPSISGLKWPCIQSLCSHSLMTIKKMTQTRRRMFFKMFSITIFLIFIIILYYELLGGCICNMS